MCVGGYIMLIWVTTPIKLGQGGRFRSLKNRHPVYHLRVIEGPIIPSLSEDWSPVGAVWCCRHRPPVFRYGDVIRHGGMHLCHGINITIIASTFECSGWWSDVNHGLKSLSLWVKGNCELGDVDGKSMAHVCFTVPPQLVPLYRLKSTSLCVPLARAWGLGGLSRYIILYSG